MVDYADRPLLMAYIDNDDGSGLRFVPSLVGELLGHMQTYSLHVETGDQSEDVSQYLGAEIFGRLLWYIGLDWGALG